MDQSIIQRNYSSLIFDFRGYKVMFDFHLAALYEVETRTLKQAVKRNIGRFPLDFMFELSPEEIDLMVSQNVIPSKRKLGGAKPMVFTEQGVAMLSSVLRSDKAIKLNIEIMRAFAYYRALLIEKGGLRVKLENLDDKMNEAFKFLMERIDELHFENLERKKIGFNRSERD